MLLCLYCHSQKDIVDTIQITVYPFKHLTNGAFFKHLSLTTNPKYIEYVDGFDYTWGVEYELLVKRTKLAQPMMDAGDTEYSLIKIISNNPVSDNTNFSLDLVGNVQFAPSPDDEPSFVFNGDETCTYLGEMTFYYPYELFRKLEELNGTTKSVKASFQFVDGNIYLISIP